MDNIPNPVRVANNFNAKYFLVPFSYASFNNICEIYKKVPAEKPIIFHRYTTMTKIKSIHERLAGKDFLTKEVKKERKEKKRKRKEWMNERKKETKKEKGKKSKSKWIQKREKKKERRKRKKKANAGEKKAKRKKKGKMNI